MAVTMASKAQTRAMKLLSVESDGTYEHAAGVLAAAGYPADGVPSQHTWRTAGKLSDADLVALLQSECTKQSYAASTADTRTHAERVADHRSSVYQQRQWRKARANINDKLRAGGYRWVKVQEEGMSALDDIDPDYPAGEWELFDPQGKPVSLADACEALFLS